MLFKNIFLVLHRLYLYVVGFIWFNTYKGFYTKPKTSEYFYVKNNKTSLHTLNYEQRIPKIIHQTHESNSLRRDNYLAVQILINMNLEYEYKFYNATERRQYIVDNFEDNVVIAYNKLNHGTFKADLFRYCVLYKEGGIYIDCKSYPFSPFRTFILSDSNFCIFIDTTDHRPQNGFIMCTPYNIIIQNTINLAVSNILLGKYGINPLDITGPEVLAKCINVAIDKSDYFESYKIGRYINKNNNIDIIGRCSARAIYFCDTHMTPLINREYKGYLTLRDIWKRYEVSWILGTIYI